MKENIFEIISQLVKRLLYEEEEVSDSEQLINSLKEDGYDIAEITEAFEFIFADSQAGQQENNNKEMPMDLIDNDNGVKQRVFNIKEKVNFNLEIQGALLQLGGLDVIKEEEFETLITKMLMRYRGTAKISDLWATLEETVDDDLKMLSISQKITQFKDLKQSKLKQVH
jgi:Smg protein